MTYKSIFQGKKKFVSIPVILGLSLAFLPFSISAAIAYAIAKYIPSNIVRIMVICLVSVVTIPVGAGWLTAMTGQSATTDHQQVKRVEGIQTETIAITPAPTSTPTPTQAVTPTLKPTATPLPIPTNTLVPTKKPIIYPTATKVPVAPKIPTITPVPVQQFTPVQESAPPQQSAGAACNCSLTCPQMNSCSEAQYQLNVCGCSARDADGDGIACDKAPLNCQP